MRHIFTRILRSLPMVTVCLALAFPAYADENAYINNIVTESEGNITIDIPDNIMDLLFPPVSTGKAVKNGPTKQAKVNVLHSGVNKLSGYRVQVFSQGHGAGSVEARAKARGSAIVAKFPKYRGQVYSYSVSPNWYTRVGNFQTSAEASRAMSELKRAFPQFAGEMRLVKCQITVVK